MCVALRSLLSCLASAHKLLCRATAAMGAPSEGSEGVYRNPMTEVQRFFDARHKGKFRIYDLRAEKGAAYDPAKFGGAVVGYRFYDHNPAPLVSTQCAR